MKVSRFTKQSYNIVILAFAFSLLYFGLFHKPQFTKPAKEIYEPNERILLQRSYPDPHFDYVAFQKAQMEVYKSRLQNQSKSAPANWVVEGPGNIGGRFNCIAVHPNNPNIMYAGAATGGVFKTINGGTNWNPVFDGQPFLAIGCITIDPGNPSTVWVGTGDANISGLCYIGDGIYKSSDAGTTWTNMGLNNQYVFSTIIVHPTNSNIIYAATMGLPFVRDNNRGLYKSVNGGLTWTESLFISNDAGIIDLVMNPGNPQILYAASYNRIRNNKESVVFGPQSKIWKTADGGNTWTALSNGLPNYPVSRIGLTIYPANPTILYAVVTDSTQYLQGIYKTIDGGATWTSIDITDIDPSIYSGFGWYFGKIYVNPGNPNQIYVLGVETYTTLNGGATWTPATPSWWLYIVHADQHFMHFITGNTILLCTDGGIYKTVDNCVTWTDIDNIPVNQVYHAIENPFVTNDYWCGVQDNGTTNGNVSNINVWNRVYGGDGFQMWIDPTDSNIVYAETQNGGIVFSNDAGNSFNDATGGINPSDRRNWDMPYIISQFNNTVLYAGTFQIYKMTGAPYGIWDSISGDLTDGLDTLRADLHTITTISESPLDANIIYVGTADANVWVTTNGGNTWNNITGTLPNRYVTTVKASPNDTGNVYVTHSGYRDNEFIPHIHKSSNKGNNWTDISGDLPQIAINDILITPGKENYLFVATDAGVYYTINGGTNWLHLGNNMPLMPVFDIEFNTAVNKVIAGTFARSVQTIDISGILSMRNNEVAKDDGIVIFPNPVSDYLTVELEKPAKLSYSIYNLKSELIKSETKYINSKLKIPFNDKSKGSYIIQFEVENKKSTKKFVKL